MRTLILDTSGRYTTVVLDHDGEAIASASYRLQPLSYLHATIHEILGRVDLTLTDLDRLAIVTGPGSWTGLNIGVTAAKTLAQVVDLPLVPLTSLDALVAGLSWPTGRVYGILDAKRDKVYCSVYSCDEGGRVSLAESEIELVPFQQLADRLAAEEGQPLVVEYGAVFHHRLVEQQPRVRVSSRERLSAAGLVETLHARQQRVLEGDAILGLVPLYLQGALGS